MQSSGRGIFDQKKQRKANNKGDNNNNHNKKQGHQDNGNKMDPPSTGKWHTQTKDEKKNKKGDCFIDGTKYYFQYKDKWWKKVNKPAGHIASNETPPAPTGQLSNNNATFSNTTADLNNVKANNLKNAIMTVFQQFEWLLGLLPIFLIGIVHHIITNPGRETQVTHTILTPFV